MSDFTPLERNQFEALELIANFFRRLDLDPVFSERYGRDKDELFRQVDQLIFKPKGE